MMIDWWFRRGWWDVVVLVVALAALVLAACGGGDRAVDATPEPGTDPSADEPTGADPADDATSVGDDGVVSDAPDDVDPGWVRLSPAGDFQAVVVSVNGGTIVLSEAGGGLISRDGGRNWVTVDWPGEVRTRAAVDADGETVLVSGIGLAAGFEGTGVISRDGGTSWLDSGAVAQAVRYVGGDEFLVATADRGVVRTVDGGATGETVIANSDLDVGVLAPIGVFVNPLDADEIYVAAASEGGTVRVFRTVDGGESVSVVAGELPLWGWTVVRFSPIGPMILSQGAGAVFSFDGGDSWFMQNQGLESLEENGLFTSLLDMVVSPASGVPVLATTMGLRRFLPSGWEAVVGPGGTVRGLAVQGRGADSGEGSRLLAVTDSGLWALAGGLEGAAPE